MENKSFKVRWSNSEAGGSFLVSFNHPWKNFEVKHLSGSRASFNTVIYIALKIAKETFGEDFLNHAFVNPYRCITIYNMSCTKYQLLSLRTEKLFGQQVYIPVISAQLICSCRGGTGFDWDERNNCSFLPDLKILAEYLDISEPNDTVEYFEWNVYTEVPEGFQKYVAPEKPVEENPLLKTGTTKS